MSEKQYFLETATFPKCLSWLKADQLGWELVLFHVPRPLGVITLNKEEILLVRQTLCGALERFDAIMSGGDFNGVKNEFPGSKIAVAVEPMTVGKVAVTLSLFSKVLSAIRTCEDGNNLLSDLDAHESPHFFM